MERSWLPRCSTDEAERIIKTDSHTGKPGSDHPEHLLTTGASNSNLSNCNAAGVVHGGINMTHYNIKINSSSARETRKYENVTGQGMDIRLCCCPITVTKSGIQEDCSSSSYQPTIDVARPFTGAWKWITDSFSSEPDTDEDSYNCEEVNDFILVSLSDITLQRKDKISSQDITDGKDFHLTNSKTAFIQVDVNGLGARKLVANAPQNYENQIPVTSLEEVTNMTADSAAKEHTNKVRPGSDHLDNIKSLHPHTEPDDHFHLERLLAEVNTIQEPWRSLAEETLLSLLAVAEKGDIAQVMRNVRFLRSKMIKTPNVVHPTANHQSFFNNVKVLQRIRNLSDDVRWRTEQNMSYIVKIAQRDPSTMEDFVTFLDDLSLN